MKHCRWTVRASCMASVLNNYGALMMLWERCVSDGVSDSDMKARIIGVQSQMESFQFLMGKK